MDHTRPPDEGKPSARTLRRYLATIRDDAWEAATVLGDQLEARAGAETSAAHAALYLHRVSLAKRDRPDALHLLHGASAFANDAAAGAAPWSSDRRRWLAIADACADLRGLLS